MLLKSFFPVLLFFLFSSYNSPDSSELEKEKILGQVIQQAITSGHFSPIQFNDDFSARTFELYLKRLDIRKQFLTQQDIKKLNVFKHDIDNQIVMGEYNLLNEAIVLMNNRLMETQSFYKEILNQPFDFTKNDSLQIDPDKLEWAKNSTELKNRWHKILKYQTLTRVYSQLEIQQKALENSDTTFEKKSFQEIEIDARKKVLKSMDDWFSRMTRLDRMDREGEFFDAISISSDPHTNYFPPKEKENFDISMSGQLEGIGATLQESEGYIKVINIVPGSASWKQGDLKVNDIILAVAQADADPIDITGMRIDDAVRLIRGKKGTEVRLTLKRTDGSIKTISIIRDIVVIEETYAKSALLKNKNERIGYIYLPKFYADFNDKNGRRCSEDIAKELIKLKQENITGLIFDLRDNGGGSLQDVVDIVGHFIPQGPVVQVKSRGGLPYVLADKDPTVLYDGKLIVMVNEVSASASEIFAAAIQDYQRGVIVGSQSTFGKGTVQRVIDLDNYLNNTYAHFKPLGSLKLTNQKFYRINGGATQLKGVASDVVLPDNFKYIDIGEKELDYPMQWTEIAPASYSSFQNSYDIEALKNTSQLRINKNSTFNLIEESAKFLKEQRSKTLITLHFEQYKQLQQDIKSMNDKFEQIKKKETTISVNLLELDKRKLETDTTFKKRSEEWMKELKSDAYLEECVFILQDMK